MAPYSHAQIESIVFDLGGVIVNLDYGLTIQAFSELAGYDVTQQYSQQSQADIFSKFEVGSITPAEFRHSLMQLLQFEADDEAINQAWSALILDFPPKRVELIRQLSQQKRIFLLSNINELHLATSDRKFAEAMGNDIGTLADQFERAYYSHLVGDRKPNTSIFQRVIDENNLDPAKTLFLDDTAHNLVGAQQIGLQTVHITQERPIESLNLLDL
ncbi:haloacid dehalogenase superfamily protein, subfamily IA, variant 3 with third motif having DD or ED [Leptolyngbya sp. PCC 7375]|nr:haloacid dehalogenase superfamily protein, subfamily IA, variant 3 with third motif having DD or ED [Leptolyngbya sp. PCC 7375]